MSIEDALNRLAAAIEKTAAVQEQIFAAVAGRAPAAPSLAATAPGPTPAPTAAGSPPAPKGPRAPRGPAASPLASPAAPGPGPTAAPKANGPVAPTSASAALKIKYDTVREAVLGCAERKGALVAQKVLSDHGVTHGKELKAEQYSSVLTAVENAMGVEAYATMMAEITRKGAPAIA
jgi:hypothetical protein